MKNFALLIIAIVFATVANGQTAEDFYKMAEKKYEQKEYPEAVKLYSKALDLKTDSAKYYFGRGMAYYRQGKLKSAYPDFTQAIYLNPKDWEAYFYRGVTLQYSRMYEDGIKDGNMVIMLAPHDSIKVWGYNANGNCRNHLGDHQGAYNDFMKALSYDSLHAITYSNLAIVMEDLGKPE